MSYEAFDSKIGCTTNATVACGSYYAPPMWLCWNWTLYEIELSYDEREDESERGWPWAPTLAPWGSNFEENYKLQHGVREMFKLKKKVLCQLNSRTKKKKIKNNNNKWKKHSKFNILLFF